jgi:hypothetical protein
MRLAALTAAAYLFLLACTAHFSSLTPPQSDALERVALFSQGSYRQGFRPMKRREQPGGAQPAAQAREETYQQIDRTDAGYSLEYGFRNFNGDPLAVKAELPSEGVAEAIGEFGYKKEDFEKLDSWYATQQKEAIASAKKEFFAGKVEARDQGELNRKMAEIKARNARIQKDLDATLASIKVEYHRRREETYAKAGFRFQSANVVEVDIPALAKRNVPRVRPIAEAFARIAESRGYAAEDLVGAVTAMVQTSLKYEIPESESGTRVVGGAWPPPKTLVMGKGDCDTKTALIASILKGWPNLKMVGLEIPEHYLMAVHRVPRRGETFIERDGLPYVMIESAGPAWLPPGRVGDFTLRYIESGKQFRIQPM